MTEEAKRIVELLNKEPFKKNYNLISFHSLGPEQLLQLLNDVLGEIDSDQGGDIRDEAPEMRAQRTLICIKNLKYSPPSNTDVSSFRQGIVLGEKPVIHPILNYLLTNLSGLKTRAYLAKYLVKLQVPDELLHDSSDSQMQDTWSKYLELQAHFQDIHKELKELKTQSHGTSEIKLDIKTMEEEKENLTRKVERARKKAEGTPEFAEALQVAQRMRKEKERGEDLQRKIQQQRRLMQSAEQRLQRLRQQVNEMKQTGSDASPETLVARMEEENKLNRYLVEEKIPKEIEMRKKTIGDLRQVAMEPVTQRDLNAIETDINQTTAQINRLVEKRLVKGNPAKDKLAMFRQQASILSHKKETIAETVQQKREEAASVERELSEKRQKLQELGGEVLKGDEYKKYVAKLRIKSNQYKRDRAELAELRSEHGVLSRTVTVLQKIHDQSQGQLSAAESRKGVTGFRETQDELEKVSAMKSELDDIKHRTLDDMSDVVQKLHAVIAEKKAMLAPIIKELRPMRQQCQEITQEHEERKAQYDGISAGLESNRAQLEHSVSALRKEVAEYDGRYFMNQSLAKIAQAQLDRANQEMKMYTSGDKKKSFREIYNRKIQEQENLTKALREQQKNVRENHETDAKQMTMWNDLQTLLQCKLSLLQQRKADINRQKSSHSSGLTMSREGSQDRMIL